MSNFASLLGDLKQSAQRAAAKTTSSGDGHSSVPVIRDGKRPASASTTSSSSTPTKRPRHSREPADKKDLSLSISFLCIGAQKGGTTWLHEQLRKHPQLCLPNQKEIHFWDWHRSKGLGWYCRQFPRSQQQQRSNNILYGECTPCYITLPETDIEEIKALFPNARLVFLARDPIDRAWSALLMELRNAVRGVEVGKFAIKDKTDSRHLQQMDKESNPDQHDDDYFLDRLRHSTHSQRCDYAGGLRRWLKYFDKEQLLIVDYNKISQDPRATLKEICDHIGVESKVLLELLSDDELKTRKNAAVGSTKNKPIRPSLRKKMEKHLGPAASDFNALLKELGYTFQVSEYK